MSEVSQVLQQSLNRIWIWTWYFWLVLMPSPKGKVGNVFQTWRNWPASEFWKSTMLCWFIKLLPMWIRAISLNTCAWTLFQLTRIPAGLGPESGSFFLCLLLSPLLKKPTEGWVELARDESCVQDVSLSTGSLASFTVPCGPGPASRDCAQSPWVPRVEKVPKWAGRLRGGHRTLQEREIDKFNFNTSWCETIQVMT